MKILIWVLSFFIPALTRVILVDLLIGDDVMLGAIPTFFIEGAQLYVAITAGRFFCKKWDAYKEKKEPPLPSEPLKIDFNGDTIPPKKVKPPKPTTAPLTAPDDTGAHFCYHCGEPLLEGSLFCRKCGVRIMDGLAPAKENLALIHFEQQAKKVSEVLMKISDSSQVALNLSENLAKIIPNALINELIECGLSSSEELQAYQHEIETLHRHAASTVSASKKVKEITLNLQNNIHHVTPST